MFAKQMNDKLVWDARSSRLMPSHSFLDPPSSKVQDPLLPLASVVAITSKVQDPSLSLMPVGLPSPQSLGPTP